MDIVYKRLSVQGVCHVRIQSVSLLRTLKFSVSSALLLILAFGLYGNMQTWDYWELQLEQPSKWAKGVRHAAITPLLGVSL